MSACLQLFSERTSCKPWRRKGETPHPHDGLFGKDGSFMEGEIPEGAMKRIRILLLVLTAVPLLTAMGVFPGDGSPDKVPIPDKKFNATFLDQMDVVTDCREVSIEGKTSVEGKKGEGIYTVSFEKISQVEFRMLEHQLYGTITLKDGSSLELKLKQGHKAYGRTKYGTFQVRLSALKKMVLQ